MKKRLFIPCILLLALLGSEPVRGGDAGSRLLKTYIVGSGDVSAVAQTVREFAGTNATVVVDSGTSRLLIMAAEDLHKEIAEIMKLADVPPKNVRIEVRITETGSDSEARLSATTGHEGMKVSRTSSGYKVQFSPEIRAQSTTQSSMAQQMLMVSSGKEASLFVGRQVPFLEWLIEYGRNWGYIRQDIVIREVGARLIVKPTVIGEGPRVSITLIPELSGLVEGRPHAIRYTQVTTHVIATDGQTMNIGGFGKNQEFYDMFLAGLGRAGSRRAVDISITPHIVGPAGN